MNVVSSKEFGGIISFYCRQMPNVTAICKTKLVHESQTKIFLQTDHFQIENIKKMSIQNLSYINHGIMIINLSRMLHSLIIKFTSKGSVRSCDFSRLQLTNAAYMINSISSPSSCITYIPIKNLHVLPSKPYPVASQTTSLIYTSVQNCSVTLQGVAY